MKLTKRNILWIVPILLIVALFFYFRPSENSDQFIAYAEGAVLLDDSTYTFKETFNQYCEEGKWTFFETSKRQNVVEFEGQCKVNDEVQPLNLQLILNNDLTNYTIGAMLVNYKVQKEADKMAIIEQIYNAYTP